MLERNEWGEYMKYIAFVIAAFFSDFAEARLETRWGSQETDTLVLSEMRGVTTNTDDNTSCFPQELLRLVNELRNRFGTVEINSANRSRTHNIQVGGARRSQHLTCNAMDFKIPGVSRQEVKLFLTANFRGRAGIGFYCNDRFHLDVGNPRQWGGCQPSRDDIALAARRYPQEELARIASLPESAIPVPAVQDAGRQVAL